MIKPLSINDSLEQEKQKQDDFPWSREKYHSEYNKYLGYYKVVSCLEHAKGTSVLDLACGDGMLTKMFSDHFERIVGVDASHSHLTEAKKNVPKAEFFECLIEEFNTEEKFDSVFLLDILEHVQDPGLVLKKAATFLEEDGVIIVHVPNSDALNRKIAVSMGTLMSCGELSPWDVEIAGHRRSYTIATLKDEVKNAGLKVSCTGGIFLKMTSTPQMDWFLKNGLWAEGDHGWGRTGVGGKDWKAEFCRACYEVGKERPEDCNVIQICIQKEGEN